MRIAARGELGLKGLVGLAVVQAGYAAVPCVNLHQHLVQIAVGRRAGHQRDMRGLLENLFAFLLGHTTDHGKLLALRLELLVIGQTVEDLLFSFVADRTGVIEH